MAEITDFHQLSDGLLGLSCVGRAALSHLERSRQADGLNLGRGRMAGARAQLPVPARHARLAELLSTVLPQLGEVYAGIEMRLGRCRVGGPPAGGDSADCRSRDKQVYLETRRPVERLDRLASLAPLAIAGPSA